MAAPYGIDAPRAQTEKRGSSSVGHFGTPPSHPGFDPFVEAFDDGNVGEALLLGGDNVPGGELVIGAGEHVFGGSVVGAVLGAVAPILVGELPALQRIGLAALESGELFLSSLMCSQNLTRITPSSTSVLSNLEIRKGRAANIVALKHHRLRLGALGYSGGI